ncbi:hypothetical protein HKX48_009110 [Thoreauomyces humboldtii]|nr:hypothetical protein HKX48_009110 [Thoreauomyces humboldtii]
MTRTTEQAVVVSANPVQVLGIAIGRFFVWLQITFFLLFGVSATVPVASTVQPVADPASDEVGEDEERRNDRNWERSKIKSTPLTLQTTLSSSSTIQLPKRVSLVGGEEADRLFAQRLGEEPVAHDLVFVQPVATAALDEGRVDSYERIAAAIGEEETDRLYAQQLGQDDRTRTGTVEEFQDWTWNPRRIVHPQLDDPYEQVAELMGREHADHLYARQMAEEDYWGTGAVALSDLHLGLGVIYQHEYEEWLDFNWAEPTVEELHRLDPARHNDVLVSCEICFDDVPVLVDPLGCNHGYCLQCYERNLRSQLVLPARCPHATCNRTFDTAQCGQIIRDQNWLDGYRRRLEERDMAGSKSV